MILNTGSLNIRAGTTACFFIQAPQDHLSTHRTWNFFPTRNTIALQATKNMIYVCLDLTWPSVNFFATNQAFGVWISFILIHSSSIPLHWGDFTLLEVLMRYNKIH